MMVTILMPCLNEQNTIKGAILEIQQEIKKLPKSIDVEILIADNGSTDESVKIAKSLGARVVKEKEKGYGSALQKGIMCARGDFIIFGDCDRSYSFSYIKDFFDKLETGADLVIGNRFKGKIDKGAMPFAHRYIGTPMISLIGKILYGTSVSDFNCGLRGIRKDSILNLKLKCNGMEYASEMIIKAQKNKLNIQEIPINFYCDQRNRKSHLRTIPDGVRHLKILLSEITEK